MKKLPNGKLLFHLQKYTHNYDRLKKKNQLWPNCAYVIYSSYMNYIIPVSNWGMVLRDKGTEWEWGYMQAN